MDRKIYKNPGNDLRIYRLVHTFPDDFEAHMDMLLTEGFGGVVTNAEWHRSEDRPGKYLCEDADFNNLDEQIDAIKKRNMGLWLYDEKGYPSASADGLTLEGHPEYEARGFTFIETKGEDYEIGDNFEKIIYACKNDGTAVEFNAKNAKGADICYVVRTVFEGSHAEKCGWGPRRYPNLMDKAAIKSFIECTYDRYFDKVKNFNEFEAVFTDEPSLMSGYVNCGVRMDYAFLPWLEELPAKFAEMHGINFYSVITELFDSTDDFKTGKLMFWQTVAEMVNEAYFVQIADWCRKHNIAFSGHCLLEECIGMHVPLYGDLLKCLKSFDYPGVDMLTGDPAQFKADKNFQFCMAAKYVGSAARMTGKTNKVMVEICPLTNWVHNGDYTFEEEIGTMDLLYMCGINHINSYLAPERLKGKFKVYADYFARVSHVMRGSVWNGKIGVYYPIENMQGYYHPEYFGMNNGAPISATEKRIQDTLFSLYSRISEAQLDYTFVDSEWIKSTVIDNGLLKLNGLEISYLVMPAVNYVDEEVLEKLDEFKNNGGIVIWENCKPDSIDAVITENAVDVLENIVDYGMKIKSDFISDTFVSPILKDGKRIWYVINSNPNDNTIEISLKNGNAFEIWNNIDGEVTEDTKVILKPYTSVFVCEK